MNNFRLKNLMNERIIPALSSQIRKVEPILLTRKENPRPPKQVSNEKRISENYEEIAMFLPLLKVKSYDYRITLKSCDVN